MCCRISQLLAAATTLCSQESSSIGLPDFPVDNLLPAVHVLVRAELSITQPEGQGTFEELLLISWLLQNTFPVVSCQQLVQRLYPYSSMLKPEGCAAVERVLSVRSSPTLCCSAELVRHLSLFLCRGLS